MTYRVTQDTSDLKHAVTQLTAIAEQSKRQADAANSQLAILRDQVGEVKKQTVAISAGADASAKSADIQRRAAAAAAIASRPEFAFAGVRGDSTGGDGPNGLTRMSFYVDLTNVGGGYLRLGSARISTSIGENLPIVPRPTGNTLDGSGIAVEAKGSQHFRVTLALTPDQRTKLNSGEDHLFVFGRVGYSSADGTAGKFCFAERIDFANDHPTGGHHQVGGPAYHCGG